MLGVPVPSLLFVLVVVGGSLSLMAWLLAGIPDLRPRPRLITDLDLEALLADDPERDLEIDLSTAPDPLQPTTEVLREPHAPAAPTRTDQELLCH